MNVKGINVGEANGNWSGGATVTNRGYRKVLCKGHPRSDLYGYVLEHILVMEKKLGRYLKRGERVHHIDHNKLNNSPENLMLFASQAEHIRYEADMRGRKQTEVTCDTCGKRFMKRNSQLSRFNFCNQRCQNPQLWAANRRPKPSKHFTTT